MEITKELFLTELEKTLYQDYLTSPQEASVYQLHNSIAKVIMSRLAPLRGKSKEEHMRTRRACYFSAEFLVGRAIYNNLLCLNLTDVVNDALLACGRNLAELEAVEDAALGNGGLGRLAACFLDSAATLNIPLDGYGIRYRYGLFEQDIVDGFQTETADNWTAHGDAWSRRCESDAVLVSFADQTVKAVPYDMPIIGYKTENVGNLRLWQAEGVIPFDFLEFNNQNYDKAVRDKNRAEDISMVLYPNDKALSGKILRLKQQYFFCCASITDIIKKHKLYHGSLETLPEFVTIQLNDTHPVISIPELMRQLMDIEGYSYENALAMCRKIFNYTNHTIMAEALEKWHRSLMKEVLPRIMEIIKMISDTAAQEMRKRGFTYTKKAALRIITGGATIHMAKLAIFVGRYINGVAEIHTEILKKSELKEWYNIYPDKFQNKTNGVTQRRWLALCNSELTAFLAKKLGDDSFLTDLYKLKELIPLADDKAAMAEFAAIKQIKKQQLANFISQHDLIDVDTNTIFDIQIKRLHEYKRQLLNAFSILYIYFGIKDKSIVDFYPTTFIFGAKSAPGYDRAKGIIKFINEIAKLIENDAEVSKLIKVVFVKNYNVSYAEKLVAAADVSVQISTAGTEASGTGNMKLMINGAVTLGTLDGANVEIVQEAGIENNYIFGAKVSQLQEIFKDYDPKELYNGNEKIKRIVDTLIDGTFDDGGSGIFKELYDALLIGANWHVPDHYYVLGDLESFVAERLKLNADYKNKAEFTKKCFINVCSSGKFSSDNTIAKYAKEIWQTDSIGG